MQNKLMKINLFEISDIYFWVDVILLGKFTTKTLGWVIY